MHERYMGELVDNVVRTETRDRIVEIVARLEERHAVQGVILGGTELSRMFPDEEIGRLRVLDTTRIHVAAALDRLLASPAGSVIRGPDEFAGPAASPS